MELPTIKKYSGGVLDGIKSKLGFAHKDASGRSHDDDYDDYADYADDGYDDYGAEGYDEYEYGDGYDNASDYTSSSSSSFGYRDRGSRSSAFEPSSPRLVSIDDVRAHTRIPDSLNRDPLPPRRTATGERSSRVRDRVLIDDTAPSPGSPESLARGSRLTGLNALFNSSARSVDANGSGDVATSDNASLRASSLPERAFGPAPGSPAARAVENLETSASVGAARSASSSSASSFDPYAALSGSGASGHAPSRGMTVLRPRSYGEVERIAKIVRAGDIAILSLKDTPDDLAKRVLDFSFGVACCAEARVDCIGSKTFAITRGSALGEAELSSLRAQGVF